MRMFTQANIIKRISIVLIVAHAVIPSNQHESFNEVNTISTSRPIFQSSFHSEDPISALQSRPAASEGQHLRQREIRNANGHIDIAVRQMEMVARVTNGIALVQSIVNGTFDSETVFSELLRLGKLEPSRIKKIDVAAFQKAFNSMKGVQLKDASEAEKFFNQLDAIRQEVDGMGKVADWNPDAFKNDIGSLSKFSRALQREVMGKVKTWEDHFSQLKHSSTVEDAKAGFSELKKKSKVLADAISRLDSTKKLGFAFKTIQSATSGFSVVSKALEGIDAYFSIVQYVLSIVHADDKFAPSSENFNAVQSIASQVPSELSGVLEAILSAYEHRKPGASQTRKSTIAFPNGFSDLGLIANDLQDGWLRKVVNTDGLRTALEPLESLVASLRVVAGKFGSPDDQKLRRVAGMVQRIEDLRSVESSTRAAESIREYMKGFTASKGAGILSMSTALKEVRNVDAAVIGMDNFVKTVIANLKTEGNMKVLHEIDKFPVEFATDAEAADAVTKFTEDAKRIRYSELTATMLSNLSHIEIAVRKSKDEILSNLDSLEAFKSDLAKFSPLFKTLQDNSELVMKMFRMIEWFKSPERDAVLADVIGIVNIVKSTDGDLDSLKEKIAVIKGSRGNETKVLAAQKDLRDVSEVIGSSTEGVVKMRRLINEPLVFDKKWIGIVGKEKQKVVSPLSPSTIKQLDQIGSIEQALAKMDDQLGQWSRGVKEQSSTLLANHSDLFTSAAAKVHGVDIDFVAVSKAVESLQKSIPAATTSSNRKRAAGPDDLSVLRSELDKFAAVGLRFTNYHPHFQQSKGSLEVLDQFFSAFARAVQPPKEPSRDRVDQGASTTTASATSLTSPDISLDTAAPEESSLNLFLVIGGIVGGIVVVVGTIGLLAYCCCYRKREADLEASLTKEKEGTEEAVTQGKEKVEALEKQNEENEQKADVLEKQNEEKDEEVADLRKQNKKKDKQVAALRNLNEKKQKKKKRLKKENKEKERVVRRVQNERDLLAEQWQERPLPELDPTQESERTRVIPMPFRAAKTFIENIYFQVEHRADVLHLKEKEIEISKPLMRRISFNGLFWICDAVLRYVDSEAVAGNTYDERYATEISVSGQILLDLSRVELRNPPNGWFRTNFMHANVVTMPNGLKMIVSQPPQDEKKKKNKTGTVDKFLWMIKENECKYVVMLCCFTDCTKGKLITECGKYCCISVRGQLILDHSRVECIRQTNHAEGYIEREQEVTFHDGSTYTFTQFQYAESKNNFVLKDLKAVTAILNRVRESPTPIVVHCSNGVGRSGVFACMELGYQMIAQSGASSLSSILGQLRSMRAGAVENVHQLGFVVIALIAYTLETATSEERKKVARKERILRAAFEMMIVVADQRILAGHEQSSFQVDSEFNDSESEKECLDFMSLFTEQ